MRKHKDKNDGYWFSTENGVHIHGQKGETPEQAIGKAFETSKNDYRQNAMYAKITDKEIVSTTPQDFRFALSEAKESVRAEDRWRVDIHDLADYESDRLFATPKGSCVAVEPDGNIISLCKHQADEIKGTDLMRYAVKNGGDRLDAFSGLYHFYKKQGFEPISWVPFDEKYAPDGWSSEYDKEPVVFWKYTGGRTKYWNDEDFFREVPASKSYDEAKELRDRSIKK